MTDFTVRRFYHTDFCAAADSSCVASNVSCNLPCHALPMLQIISSQSYEEERCSLPTSEELGLSFQRKKPIIRHMILP